MPFNAPLPGLLVAANASHAGKTSTCLALIAALAQRSLSVQPAKAGPDFIDASYLAAFARRPCVNLDLWMHGKRGLMRLLKPLQRDRADLLLVEGAMGLYDGGRGSSFELARALNLPVLLLLNASGMGESVAALAQGFLDKAQGKIAFAGLILTHTGSSSHSMLLARSLRSIIRRYHLPLLGCLPRAGSPRIASRHLGLVDIAESLPDLDRQALANWLEQHLTLDPLLKSLKLPAKQNQKPKTESSLWPSITVSPKKGRIAIARDRAFSFCYADLPAFFAEEGFAVTFFSPLTDAAPPACDAIYLPGGYPELFAHELANNDSMIKALQAAHALQIPIYGECGGYLYLLQELVLGDGTKIPMAGLLPDRAVMQSELAGLGYRQADLCWNLLSQNRRIRVRGHEFHYARVESRSDSPLWSMQNRQGRPLGPAGSTNRYTAGSFLHLAVQGSLSFWRAWLGLSQRTPR